MMDGHLATRKIREWEQKNNRKPMNIVEITA